MRTLRLALIFGLLLPVGSLFGQVIFATTTTPTATNTFGGTSLSKNQFFGNVFTLTAQAHISGIGAFLSVRDGGTIFGAIVPVSATAPRIPSGNPFDAGTLASATLSPLANSSVVTAPVSVDLPAGTYAVVFGTGYFGATSQIGDFPLSNGTSVVLPAGSNEIGWGSYCGGGALLCWQAFSSPAPYFFEVLGSYAAPPLTLSSISPTSATAGDPALTLTVNGSGFLNGSTVLWNGSALATTFVNANQLTASVPASLIASQGIASVTVLTSGVTTGAATFTIGFGMSLSRTSLNFAVSGSTVTSAQPVGLTFKGASGVAWSTSSSQPNITVTPASGVGNAILQVSATAGSSGVITVSSPATNSPLQIQVNVTTVNVGAPFGSFDTPTDGTTGISGAIAVTGWALDNIEVTNVDLWRERIGTETVTANGLVFIGNAVFVSGARPDVESLNPTVPLNYRAGWGYLLLTNELPNSNGSAGLGNGTYRLHAIAHDKTGLATDLGTKTITVDNTHATKPFGTIDTPDQGGTASLLFTNFGWALAQNPNCIPSDGSTITVMVDGVTQGHPTYNQFRSDIATFFPGHCNSMGAVGYFFIDTTKLVNGTHTISWIVFDDHGAGDGLGSRFFNVFNSNSSSVADDTEVEFHPAISLRHGLDKTRAVVNLKPDPDGIYSVDVEELGQVELNLSAMAGSQVVGIERRPLPIGSALVHGVFHWQLGPGFLGTHQLEFSREYGAPVRVRVTIRPKAVQQARPTAEY